MYFFRASQQCPLPQILIQILQCAEISKNSYSRRMKPIYRQLSIYLIAALLIPISACERETYTSWNCKNPASDKQTMVLKKAQMQFAGGRLNYCGSLGEKSYFDANCPALIQDAQVVFTPSTGLLLDRANAFQCEAL